MSIKIKSKILKINNAFISYFKFSFKTLKKNSLKHKIFLFTFEIIFINTRIVGLFFHLPLTSCMFFLQLADKRVTFCCLYSLRMFFLQSTDKFICFVLPTVSHAHIKPCRDFKFDGFLLLALVIGQLCDCNQLEPVVVVIVIHIQLYLFLNLFQNINKNFYSI